MLSDSRTSPACCGILGKTGPNVPRHMHNMHKMRNQLLGNPPAAEFCSPVPGIKRVRARSTARLPGHGQAPYIRAAAAPMRRRGAPYRGRLSVCHVFLAMRRSEIGHFFVRALVSGDLLTVSNMAYAANIVQNSPNGAVRPRDMGKYPNMQATARTSRT